MKKKMQNFNLKPLLLFLLVALTAGVGQAQYDGTGTFTKITSEAELTDGYYVIAEANGDAFAMSNDHDGSLFPEEEITPSGGSLTNPGVGSKLFGVDAVNSAAASIRFNQPNQIQVGVGHFTF
ncbi:MAG: hypothetical protein LC664_16185 [Flavobacteriales bacterium]|nr:hypothetical protein [Flavobacteriales bacterium]